jgi:beta-lactamase class A
MAQKYKSYYIYRPGMNSYPGRQKSKKSYRTIGQKFSLVVWLLILSCGVYFVYAQHTQAISNQREASIADAAKRAAGQQHFATAVQQIIDNHPEVTYSVSAIDITSGSSVKIGSSAAMNAASCGKVLTAALFLHKVENNEASLNDKIGGKSSQYQLRQLIQKSDDNSWYLFNNKLTHEGLSDYALKQGLNSYDPDTDYISSEDMSSLLQKLYKGELLNPKHTRLLLSYMQDTNYEQFIVPAVPSSKHVYHKVGFVDGEINDAAIISNGHESVALTIFSRGSDISDQYTRAQTIQEITKAALNLL